MKRPTPYTSHETEMVEDAKTITVCQTILDCYDYSKDTAMVRHVMRGAGLYPWPESIPSSFVRKAMGSPRFNKLMKACQQG